MWGWLKAITSAFLEWLEKRSEKPKTIEDDQTPADLKRDWADYVADELRDKPDNGNRQPK